jgi:hypothetical protein
MTVHSVAAALGALLMGIFLFVVQGLVHVRLRWSTGTQNTHQRLVAFVLAV